MPKVQTPTLAQKRRMSARIADIAAKIYCSKMVNDNGNLFSIQQSVDRAAAIVLTSNDKAEELYGKGEDQGV